MFTFNKSTKIGKIYDDEPDKQDLEDTNWIDRHLMIDNPKFQHFIQWFVPIVIVLAVLYFGWHLLKYSGIF